MTPNKSASRLAVHPEKCTGCQVCQLQCSFSKTGVFNPHQARIAIEWDDEGPKPVLQNDCDGCGVCARFCVYGALTLAK